MDPFDLVQRKQEEIEGLNSLLAERYREIMSLKQEIQALKAKNEKLHSDSVQLDWILYYRPHIGETEHGDPEVVLPNGPRGSGPTYRKAVKVAMKNHSEGE